ncbi:hypothetical protein, partial [Microcoleus sp. B4-D1]|uniref:hypothetical protein n=1 Tax=Microcoleus sp. B4-D1 TaxID=2818666 RepID=UPI002FD12E5B
SLVICYGGMGVPPVLFGRAGRPSHFQEWKLFNSHSLAIHRLKPFRQAGLNLGSAVISVSTA